jgi:alpha/beta superfamily hydrolase
MKTHQRIQKFILASILSLGLGLGWSVAGAQSCNGGRYQDSTFALVDTMTVTYGANTIINGTPIDLKAIIYSPNGDTATQRPIVLVLFGGSFVSGSRFESYVTQTCTELAKRGYVAAAIDYRIGVAGFSANELYKTVYRAQQDALSAVRYMRRNATALGIRPDLVYLWGFSAGAICSLQCAYLQPNELPSAIDTTVMGNLSSGSGNPGYSNMIRGVISNAGGLGDTNWIKGPEAVQVASIHNLTDPTVPYNSAPLPFPGAMLYGSNSVHKRLTRFGIPNSLHTTNSQGMHLPQAGSPYIDTFAIRSLAALYGMVCRDFGTIVPTSLPDGSGQMVARPYPNPTSGLVQFAGLDQLAQCQVYDARAQLVLDQSTGPDQPLDLGSLRAGIYHYQIRVGNKVRQGQLVKQ